jgi:hypothetical protein
MAKRKKTPLEEQSESYMRLRIFADGVQKELRIPTFYDHINKIWIGAIHTPKTKKFIHASGKDSKELQENTNEKLQKMFDDPEMSDELFSMFEDILD